MAPQCLNAKLMYLKSQNGIKRRIWDWIGLYLVPYHLLIVSQSLGISNFGFLPQEKWKVLRLVTLLCSPY